MLSECSIATIWGGASLLSMHLKVMQELVKMKESKQWDWDYIFNLSEADFPIKWILFFILGWNKLFHRIYIRSIKQMSLFINEYNNYNFLPFADHKDIRR